MTVLSKDKAIDMKARFEYEFYTVAGEVSVRARRYGEEWRDFIGDKAIAALFQYALAARRAGMREGKRLAFEEAAKIADEIWLPDKSGSVIAAALRKRAEETK